MGNASAAVTCLHHFHSADRGFCSADSWSSGELHSIPTGSHYRLDAALRFSKREEGGRSLHAYAQTQDQILLTFIQQKRYCVHGLRSVEQRACGMLATQLRLLNDNLAPYGRGDRPCHPGQGHTTRSNPCPRCVRLKVNSPFR